MNELYVKCPACNKKQRHKILRIKDAERGIAICKCTKCGSLSYSRTKAKDVEVMLILSEGGKAKKKFKKFPLHTGLRKGGSIQVGDQKFEIRSIEGEDGERVEKTEVELARTIWIAPYTKQLSISVHQKGGKTIAYKVVKDKDEEIATGDIIEIGNKKIEISKILEKRGEMKKGRVSDILSLHGRFLD